MQFLVPFCHGIPVGVISRLVKIRPERNGCFPSCTDYRLISSRIRAREKHETNFSEMVVGIFRGTFDLFVGEINHGMHIMKQFCVTGFDRFSLSS